LFLVLKYKEIVFEPILTQNASFILEITVIFTCLHFFMFTLFLKKVVKIGSWCKNAFICKWKKKLVEQLINTITKTDGIEKIILFGSRARSDAELKSDIDIAIICPTITKREWLDICDRIENIDTLLKIDVVRFDLATENLKQRILQEGVILYER
jgi:predicted nucleotidyltransferase